jgi:hypothetical protein
MNRPLLGESYVALTLFKRFKMHLCYVLWMCEMLGGVSLMVNIVLICSVVLS